MYNKKKKLVSIFSILMSMLLVAQNCQVAFAARVATLSLQTDVVNASVVDPSKNILTIQNATGLSTTVTVKPTAKTLKNGKSVKIEGTFDNDNLLVDLSALGPANLIPGGKYIITGTRGKTKSKATFTFNPPTLIIGKLKVPVAASEEKKARIIRYQQTGNASVLAAEDTPKSATAFISDFNTHKPIPNTSSIEIQGATIVEPLDNGRTVTFNVYQLFEEVPANIADQIAGKTIELGATFEAQSAAGTPTTYTYHTLTNIGDENNNGIINNVNATPATTAAVNECAALNTNYQAENHTADVIPIDTKDFKGLVETFAPADVAAETPDQSLLAAKSVAEARSTEVDTSLREIVQNAGVSEEDAANIAAPVALKTDIISKPTEELALKGDGINPLKNIDIDIFASGFNRNPLPTDLALDAIKAGGVPNSLEVKDLEALDRSLHESGTLSSFSVKEGAVDVFASTLDDAQKLGIDTSQVKFPIQSAADVDLTPIAKGLIEKFGNRIPINLDAGCFVSASDANVLKGITVEAPTGVYTDPKLASNFKHVDQVGDLQTPFGSTPPTNGVGFVSQGFAANFQNRPEIYTGTGSTGTRSTQGAVFQLDTGRPDTGSTPTGGLLTKFDPSNSQQFSAINTAFASAGNQAGQIFGGTALSLTHLYVQNGNAGNAQAPGSAGTAGSQFAPQGLFNLAHDFINDSSSHIDLGDLGEAKPIGDIVKGFSGPQGTPTSPTGATSGPDLGIFAGTGSTPFSHGGSTTPTTFPGSGATGGTFPGGGATGGTFPGGFGGDHPTTGGFPTGDHPTTGGFPTGGTTTGEFPTGGTTTGTFTGGTTTGTFTGGTTTTGTTTDTHTGTFSGTTTGTTYVAPTTTTTSPTPTYTEPAPVYTAPVYTAPTYTAPTYTAPH